MLELHHISKHFSRVPALDDVSITIKPGQILGLLGENGAGKSTLMHILFGLIRPDAAGERGRGGGSIRIDGRPFRITSPRIATAMGIGMVHQHFKLVPTLTAAENVALFMRERVAVAHGLTAGWLKRLAWSVPLDQPMESLALGQQQRIEIVKALLAMESASGSEKMRTLILDEPTAVLTPQETVQLFRAMRTLCDARTAIVFISHKIAEVQKICDYIAILRRGKLVHEGPLSGTTSASIAEKMVGAPVNMPVASRAAVSTSTGTPALEIRNISTAQLHSVSLSIAPGEIVGIAGVDGNGQSHLVQAILKTLPAHGLVSGSIHIAGEDVTRLSTRQRLDRIAFIAEDRQREALILPLSIRDNLLLKDYRSPRFSTLGFLRFGAWRTHAQTLVRDFDVRTASIAEPAQTLSGGNQQKVVLARELHSKDNPIVLAVNPTRGLDVAATAFTLRKLIEARDRGAAVLLIHSDLDELLSISDRVAVLYNGSLTTTDFPRTGKDQIAQLMLGVASTGAGGAS